MGDAPKTPDRSGPQKRKQCASHKALCANIRETVLVLLINEQGEKEKGRDEREFSWCGSFPWGFG